MDEQLIAEVQQHGVIYNRQKYFLNNIGGTGKYESKEEAWQIIAMRLGSDVDTCKKRWKYLRERYVSQRKQSDPPIYEHLSRPYLEKMKFLDEHIQPRKSYRNVPSFLTSPNGTNSFAEFHLDSSKSNSSIKNLQYPNFTEGTIKTEPDQALREFAAAVASQQLQMNTQTTHSTPKQTNNSVYYDRLRDNEANHIPSSSSSLKSPLSSPPTTVENNDSIAEMSKKPRVQIKSSRIVNANNVDENSSDENDDCIDHLDNVQDNHRAFMSNGRNSVCPAPPPIFPNNDFLLSLYQQMPQQNRHSRSSEQLLGELVTSELLKMNKERRKSVQKKILEILFFDD